MSPVVGSRGRRAMDRLFAYPPAAAGYLSIRFLLVQEPFTVEEAPRPLLCGQLRRAAGQFARRAVVSVSFHRDVLV